MNKPFFVKNEIRYPSLMERLKSQHKDISAMMAHVDGEGLIFRPEPDKWNIHDHIVHLATYQPVFIERTHKILAMDNPAFDIYKADGDAEFIAWRPKPMALLLEKIDTDREVLFQLFVELPDDKLERKGIHPKFGNLTISEWAEFFLLHEAHHLFTIFRLAHGGM